jgi:hypothetical protein
VLPLTSDSLVNPRRFRSRSIVGSMRQLAIGAAGARSALFEGRVANSTDGRQVHGESLHASVDDDDAVPEQALVTRDCYASVVATIAVHPHKNGPQPNRGDNVGDGIGYLCALRFDPDIDATTIESKGGRGVKKAKSIQFSIASEDGTFTFIRSR